MCVCAFVCQCLCACVKSVCVKTRTRLFIFRVCAVVRLFSLALVYKQVPPAFWRFRRFHVSRFCSGVHVCARVCVSSVACFLLRGWLCARVCWRTLEWVSEGCSCLGFVLVEIEIAGQMRSGCVRWLSWCVCGCVSKSVSTSFWYQMISLVGVPLLFADLTVFRSRRRIGSC